MTMYKMKEKTFKKVYFIVLFLIMFIIATSIYNNHSGKNRLELSAEESFNRMVLESQEQIINELEDLNSGNYAGDRELTEYSSIFENLYFKQLIYQEITLEEAFSDFEKTDSYEILRQRYKEGYKEDYLELKSESPLSKRIIGETTIWFLSVLSLILLAIATPLNLIISFILIIGFYFIIKLIYPLIYKEIYKKGKKKK